MKRRTQFGNPRKPEWGQSYKEFSHRTREEITEKINELAEQDPKIQDLASQFHKSVKSSTKYACIGPQSIYELFARVGIMLNEIDTAKNE